MGSIFSSLQQQFPQGKQGMDNIEAYFPKLEFMLVEKHGRDVLYVVVNIAVFLPNADWVDVGKKAAAAWITEKFLC